MLGDDGIVGVEDVGLGEQVIGLVILAKAAGLGRRLHKLSDAVFADVCQGEDVVAVGGIELYGAGEAALGGRQVSVLDVFCAFKVGIIGLPGLLFRDFGIRIGRGDAGRERNGAGGGVLSLQGRGEGQKGPQRRGKKVANADKMTAEMAEARHDEV